MIDNFKNVVSETNTKLSAATKDWNTYTGQQSQKEDEEVDVHKQHIDDMTSCKTTIENYAAEKCALTKIRGELLKMDSLPNNITDCEVGDWEEEPCDEPCAGGEQKLTRSVTEGWRGAKC